MSNFDFAIKSILPPADSSGNKNTVPIDPAEITEDFAKMLISQISNQDPDKPMDATEIISQYATMLSSLGVARMANQSEHYEQVRIATSAINKIIDYDDGSGAIQSGTVVAADFTQDSPLVILNGGIPVPVGNIISISD